MPDPAWASSPPEVNYLRLVGAGAGGTATTVASGAAWQTLTASSELAASVSTLNTDCTAVEFEGVGGAASTVLATELNGALHLLAGWAADKPEIAAAAVGAYEFAVSTMIPAEISLANRTEQAADVAINPLVFGALTPAVIALDLTYFGEYWPHNAGLGAAYGAALTGLTAALTIPPPVLFNSSPTAGSAAASEAVAQSLGQAAIGETLAGSSHLADQTGTSPPAAVMNAAVGPLSSLAPAANSLGGLTQSAPGMFTTPIQALGGLSAAVGATDPYSDDGSGFDGAGYPAPLPMVGSPVATVGGAAFGGSIGTGSIGIGAVSGSAAALTTYARPAVAFPAEIGGRPIGLRFGDGDPVGQRGPVTAGIGAVPTPVGARGKSTAAEDAAVQARIVLRSEPPTEAPN